MNPALARCYEICGSQTAFARLLGVTPAALWKWNNNGVPLRRVSQVVSVMAAHFGFRVAHHELRPDFFPAVPITHRYTPVSKASKPGARARRHAVVENG